MNESVTKPVNLPFLFGWLSIKILKMAFAFSIPHHFTNPNLTFNLNNGGSIHLRNPRNPSPTRLSSPMTSASTAHGFGINYINTARPLNPKLVVRSSANSSPSQAPSVSKKTIIFWSAVTLVLAVGNRVLYKLALVPMKEYPFFLAQVNTFGYVVIYFSILYMRHHAGIVTHEMMTIPKWRFAVIGMLEALGVVAGMYSAAMLPGPAIPILNQCQLLSIYFPSHCHTSLKALL